MALRLLISGRVQGVGFRYSTAEVARRLGVSGWVRNRRNGSVEIHLEGNAEAIAQLKLWARRGPPAALVDGLTADTVPDEGLQGFEQRATE